MNFLLISCALVCSLLLPTTILAQKPWEPWPQSTDPNSWWQSRHRSILEQNAREGPNVRVVFDGASLVEYFDRPEGRGVWDRYYAPVGSVNHGFGGDSTHHMLWRIENGEYDGINPKLIVVNIGSNNVGGNPNNDEIVRGVNTVVDKLHEKCPNANILLVGNFPRGDVKPVRTTLERMLDIDTKLKSLVDGDQGRRSFVLDVFWQFTKPDMSGVKPELFLQDEIHFNEDGYNLWQREMNDIFNRLLQ